MSILGKIDVTKQVIEHLRASLPRFKRFFDTHYDLVTKQSLVPSYGSDGQAKFPAKTKIVPKNVTIEDKIKYYYMDIEEFKESSEYGALLYGFLECLSEPREIYNISIEADENITKVIFNKNVKING